jgi:PDZ domain-containing protein
VRRLSPARLGGLGLFLLAVVVLALWVLPSDSYIFLPDRAHPVAPLVKIDGRKPAHDDNGGIYFVDVFVRKASWLERLFPSIRDGATIVPASAVVPPGTSEKARVREDRQAMTRSQSIAAAVALRAAGYKVRAKPTGVLVDQIVAGAPAAGKLQPADVIVQVDGRRILTPAELRSAIRSRPVGSRLRIVVRRGASLVKLVLRSTTDPQAPGRPVIGVIVTQNARIELPLSVSINAGSVGGPSAGLAFALDVLEQLGRDVDHGRRIAATGEIELDGSVQPIGGVKQKTIGVRKTGIRVFLVPAGENASEARRYADGLRIVPVKNFQQALRALATLSRAQ